MIEHIEQYSRHVSGHYGDGKPSPSWLKLWKRKNWSVTIEMLNIKRRKKRVEEKWKAENRNKNRKRNRKKIDGKERCNEKVEKERMKEKKKERKQRPKLVKFKIEPK